MIIKYFRRLPHAIRGIIYALTKDFGYRTQVYAASGVGILVFILYRPLETWETLFIILAWALILITELQNSALEAALDRLHPEIHDGIKHSKDMAAGAVLTAGIFLGIVLIILGWERFM